MRYSGIFENGSKVRGFALFGAIFIIFMYQKVPLICFGFNLWHTHGTHYMMVILSMAAIKSEMSLCV